MSIDLKPCPNCGCAAALTNYVIEAAINCTGCPARMSVQHAATEDTGIAKVIAAWNTRAIEQPTHSDVDLIADILARFPCRAVGDVELDMLRRREVAREIAAITSDTLEEDDRG